MTDFAVLVLVFTDHRIDPVDQVALVSPEDLNAAGDPTAVEDRFAEADRYGVVDHCALADRCAAEDRCGVVDRCAAAAHNVEPAVIAAVVHSAAQVAIRHEVLNDAQVVRNYRYLDAPVSKDLHVAVDPVVVRCAEQADQDVARYAEADQASVHSVAVDQVATRCAVADPVATHYAVVDRVVIRCAVVDRVAVHFVGAVLRAARSVVVAQTAAGSDATVHCRYQDAWVAMVFLLVRFAPAAASTRSLVLVAHWVRFVAADLFSVHFAVEVVRRVDRADPEMRFH